MRFKIDWASLIVGSKFTVFALFYFVFESNFPSTSPRLAYIWRDNLTEGFLRYRFVGLIFGGAYFRNFTVVCFTQCTLFFSLNTFDFYCQFVCHALSEGCNEDKCWQTCPSRVAWLVYVRTYCVPVATLNQNKRSRLL